MGLDDLSVNTIRVLAADIVQKANSGHPGMPMGMAAAAHVLWSKIMTFSPSNPSWINRDRFVLSNGHGCALLYSLLHLSGFDLSIDDLKQFRQWGSKTPGHPEAGHSTPGVEVSTGPLGQGISNAVGLAIAQKHASAVFNKPDAEVISNYTFVFCGDGCLMEGISSEASSLAGHLGLGNLIVIYDDNKISIDGSTSLAFTEDVLKRYESYGWHTSIVEDGNTDLAGIEGAIRAAQAVKDKPSIIALRTIIAFMSAKQGDHETHGAPLGAADIAGIKKRIGFDPEKHFFVPDEVYKYWAEVKAKGSAAEAKWKVTVEEYCKKYPSDGAQFTRIFSGKLPEGWKSKLPVFPTSTPADATRNYSGKVLNAVAELLPELMGGSADLTPSNKTLLKIAKDFQKDTPTGRYLRFGVREHGMMAIGNGISAYGGFIPFTATFLNFISYGFPSVRLSALSHHRHILIMTHDSIGLGEDGPTHQPVEILSLCRATPRILTMRPADGNEVSGAYMIGLEYDGPTVICCSRQNVPSLAASSPEKVALGAYVVEESKSSKPDLIYIATGSEVGIALDSAKASGKNVRVVSAPCLELFDKQPVSYRREVLTPGVPIISIEASGPLGWEKYAHFSISIKQWGASAPYQEIYKQYGFVPEKIIAKTSEYLGLLKEGGISLLRTHYDI